MPSSAREIILDHLVALYGETEGRAACIRLLDLLQRYSPAPEAPLAPKRSPLSQRDAILITYGDQLAGPGLAGAGPGLAGANPDPAGSRPGDAPLHILEQFCVQHLSGLVSAVHILPFYPYSSDDGFSVIDYRAVDPALGAWDDVAALGRRFRLMFDAVINHTSVRSAWFRSFLKDDPTYRGFFIVVEDDPDLSQVVRPRALPLLTQYNTPSGSKSVWTTFSADQVDLNYANPAVLLEILDLLLFYASRGAQFIRLDAIAYLWKQIGTSCIHLPQTHRVIQLIRAVLDAAAPQVLLITETNVPHRENLSYFGDGTNEAQLVYNFALPPLVLHTLRSGSARALSHWVAGLDLPPTGVTFFNFLASHDGIGLNPARGILTGAEIDDLVAGALLHGGLVSYKSNPDGSRSPYELNINYFDALSEPAGDEPETLQVGRFLAAHAIMFALVGVPGIYFHSLFGSRGWRAGAELSGHNRTINRQKLLRDDLEHELRDPNSRRSQVYTRLARMLTARAGAPAFHPSGKQRVLELGEAVFGLVRAAPDASHEVCCLHNVTGRRQAVALDWMPRSALVDLITGRSQPFRPGRSLSLDPYQTLWLARGS